MWIYLPPIEYNTFINVWKYINTAMISEVRSMLMNYRCPGCGNTMEFSPSDQKLYCVYCGSSYSVEEMNAIYDRTVLNENPENIQQPQNAENMRQIAEEQRSHASIKMQILHCRSCGAELAVNGVETSSFCVYCGQATVVLDRVEDYLQPEYIIPFRITKEKAEAIIRGRISQGGFIPDEIKNFKTERLRGIYIPFWLYDIYYGDNQYWKYTVRRGKSTSTRYTHRIGDCFFKKMTLDASRNLNDDSSQRLEPYNMHDLQSFDPAYLSGFYSDRFDVGTAETDRLAISRAGELFNESMKETIKYENPVLVSKYPVHSIKKREYALLPAWFLTFRYEDTPYTILVNGQTGKMVGAVPYVKKKAVSLLGVLSVLFCLILATIGAWLTPHVLTSDEGRLVSTYFILIGLGIVTTWSTAIKKYKAMLVSIGLTRSGTTNKYVSERAGR